MDRKKALRLAIEALQKERQQIAWDANVVKATGAGSPVMRKRRERYLELEQALFELRKLREEQESLSG